MLLVQTSLHRYSETISGFFIFVSLLNGAAKYNLTFGEATNTNLCQ